MISRRRIFSHIMTGATVLAAILAVVPLLAILIYLIAKGASSIDLQFFIKNPAAPGSTGGGVANAIVGSGIIVAMTAGIALPIGIGSGIYLNEYGRGRFGWFVGFVADILNGTPSIIVGVFVWTLMVRPMGHFSALAGAVALSILVIPMVTRTTQDMLALVPNSLREAALALGYSRARTSLTIVIRTAWPGIMTGVLVAIARVTGETAPLLFTALGNLNFKTNVMQPMQTLSLQVYVYATGPFPEWHRLAWGVALVLVMLVFVFGLVARLVTKTKYRAR